MQALVAGRAAGLLRLSVFVPTLCAGVCFIHTAESERGRPSRRRYAAVNTRGRAAQAKELLDEMKKSPQGAKAFYDALHPRDRLDISRLLHERRKKRRSGRGSPKLTKYYSALFEKNYFFREEDIVEESTLGRGPGGQATNRRMQTAVVKHVPSGLIVKFSRFPSLWLNRRTARELLSLRLEEHLLGPASRLGRARVAQERRRRRRHRTMEYLNDKGVRLKVRDTRRCHWLAFLTGKSPLPRAAVSQMTLEKDAAALPVTTAVLFGSECNSWWPKLKAAAESAATVGGDVPLLLQYLFPCVYANSSRAERDEIAVCKSNEAVRTNVRRALACFCELFGLHLRRIASSEPTAASRLVLEKDGLNWIEYRPRMIINGFLTPLARTCWPHVYMSLRGLDLKPEARAIVIFFKNETKTPEGSASGAWAAEALQCFADAVQRSKPPATRQLSSTNPSSQTRVE